MMVPMLICPWCNDEIASPVLAVFEEHVFLHPQFGAIPSVDIVSTSCPLCSKEFIVEASVVTVLEARRGQ